MGKVLKLLDAICPNCLVKVMAMLLLPQRFNHLRNAIAYYIMASNFLLSQRQDTNEVEVNVDLLTGRAFREAGALTNSILPDVVLSSGGRRGTAKAASISASSATDMQEE